MAHLDAEAADAPAPRSVDEMAADFEQFVDDEDLDGEPEGEPDDSQSEDGAEDGEDLELDEQDEEGDEPEAPAIDRDWETF